MKKSKIKLLVAFIAICLLAGAGYVGAKVYQYKTYIWLPYYFKNSCANNLAELAGGHVIFLIADHHEPGFGEKGLQKSRAWCSDYRRIVDGIYDDYGNPVQYTWFYPYDHLNSEVVLHLNQMVFDGLGEIEFQWHHGPDDDGTFRQKLGDAVGWFNSHGCMLSSGKTPKPHFGFVHGNWALDNSPGDQKYCGVNRELDILKEYGCYADFTFATLATEAQPSMVNCIYYAKDTSDPKSYDYGRLAEVGYSSSDFMIFQGPMSCDWHDLVWDCAALESTSPFRQHRAKLWLKFSPTVKRRADWLFLKVYTHGVQSKDTILDENFREMFSELKKECGEYGLKIHFVTAREAYNIVKAAEDGHMGNPEDYRDYAVPKPINRLVRIDAGLASIMLSESEANIELLAPENASLLFKAGSVQEVSGFLARYQYRHDDTEKPFVGLEGKGTIRVVSNAPLEFRNKVLGHAEKEGHRHVYTVEAADLTSHQP